MSNIGVEEARIIASDRFFDKCKWWYMFGLIFCIVWLLAVLSLVPRVIATEVIMPQGYFIVNAYGYHEIWINPIGPSYLDGKKLKQIVVNPPEQSESKSSNNGWFVIVALIPSAIGFLYFLHANNKEKAYKDAFIQYVMDNKEFPDKKFKV